MLLCTVHKSKFNAMYRPTEYLLSPVTVQDIVPPHCKKNEHTQVANVGPSGQINKLSVFKRAIQYLTSKIPDNPSEEDRDTLHKCNLVIVEEVAYTKAIQKEKKEVREMKKLLTKKTSTVDASTFKV